MNKLLVSIVCIAIILTGCMAQSLAATGQMERSVSLPFNDTAKHWAVIYIDMAVEKGYVKGYEDGTFRPDQTVTRAEFATMMVKAMGQAVAEPAKGESWYLPYAKAAEAVGLYQSSDFSGGAWDVPMNRGEMARMAARAIGEKNDDPKKWMYLVTKAGIMSGYPGGVLGEDRTTTRAESLVVIEKVLKVKAGEKLSADKYAVSAAELAWHKTNIKTVIPEYFGTAQPGFDWNPSNMVITTGDGKFKGELVELIAIDLADPNDPNIKKLPVPVNKLKWYSPMPNTPGYPVMNYKDTYLVWFKQFITKIQASMGKLYSVESAGLELRTIQPLRKAL